MNELKTPKVQQLEGDWQQFKGKVKAMWADLTDDELDKLEGKWDQLVGRIKEKTGEDRETVRNKIDEIASEAKYRV